MWNTVKAWFKNSVTILWARILSLGGTLLAIMLPLFGDSSITGAVQSVLQPQYIPYYVIAIGLITELVRRRTVNQATDENNQVKG